MKPIRRKKVSEEIAERIASDINANLYKPGDRLPSERELMTLFGCGRSAVREALFALQLSGFLRIRTGERATVTEPNRVGVRPKALESRTRISLPPALTCTMLRIVKFGRPLSVPGKADEGAEAQVPTQRAGAAWAGEAAATSNATASRKRVMSSTLAVLPLLRYPPICGSVPSAFAVLSRVWRPQSFGSVPDFYD